MHDISQSLIPMSAACGFEPLSREKPATLIPISIKNSTVHRTLSPACVFAASRVSAVKKLAAHLKSLVLRENETEVLKSLNGPSWLIDEDLKMIESLSSRRPLKCCHVVVVLGVDVVRFVTAYCSMD